MKRNKDSESPELSLTKKGDSNNLAPVFTDTDLLLSQVQQVAGLEMEAINGGFSMSLNYEISAPNPLILINDIPMIKYGEILALVALPGTGKSQMINIFSAVWVAYQHRIHIESFGIHYNRNVSKGNKILVIDTERTRDDCRESYGQIFRRLGGDKNRHIVNERGEINCLDYICFVDIPSVELRKKALEARVSTGNYSLVIIDGILDLSTSLNDETETSELIRWLRSIANKYSFGLIVTLHPNKGTETMAGHLGAFLYRFCRACLLMKSHPNDRTVKMLTNSFEQGKLSHGGNGELQNLLQWSDDEKMFVQVHDEPEPVRITYNEDQLRTICNEFHLKGVHEIPAGELQKRYAEALKMGSEAARKQIAKAFSDGKISKSGAGKATRYAWNKTSFTGQQNEIND
jgi:hypothetical protein